MKKYKKSDVKKFLTESNYIESEFSGEAFEDALSAWSYISSFKTIDISIILDVHRLLMNRLRPDIAGKWRNCDVFIGGKRKMFISESLLKEDVLECLTNMGISPELPSDTLEEFVKACHVQFEAVHPFEDGNGRTGRILMNWQRLQLGLPIKIIKADWNLGGDEQKDYYGWFKD